MSVTSSFSQQQQFHLLVNIRGSDHYMTVLPGGNRRFLIIETGKTLGIFSGRTLIEKGITVTIPTTYTAEVLTIEKQ